MSIPVIVLENKVNKGRYLAASIDQGDWADENLDVSNEHIANAYMIWRKDFTKPTAEDVENVKKESDRHKQLMIEKFGVDAVISFDFEKWLKYYNPVNIEITKEQFEQARSWDE